MILRPIPRNLMPSTATVWEPVTGDYGGTFAEEGKTITGVRFDRHAPLQRLGYVETDGLQGLLYVDAVNSAGAFAIPEGSKVQIDSLEPMQAVVVHEFQGFNGAVHHWEVELR